MTTSRVSLPSRRRAMIGAAHAPRGSTLTEVLMAILIMSIGVVSVATMFPLSLMRSVQANQLTAGTILRYNAQAQLETNPMLVFYPEGLRSTTAQPDVDPNFIKHFNKKYMVDPAGFFAIQSQQASLKGTFGNDGAATPAPVGEILRYPGFDVTNLDLNGDSTKGTVDDGLIAGRIVTGLPDSWKNVVEADVVSIPTDRKSVVLASTVDLSDVILGPTVKYRAVVFDAEGKHSQSRELTGATSATRTLTWKDRLPSRIGTPSKVRIDVHESKYTWMLTVRRQPLGAADIDVVVFDKRPFVAKDEQVFTNGSSKPVFTLNSRTATVQFNTANRPWLRKGGWVLDLQNAHWYRVQGIRERDLGAGDGSMEAELQFTQPASGDGKWAVFMRGVVDVYPIGTMTHDN